MRPNLDAGNFLDQMGEGGKSVQKKSPFLGGNVLGLPTMSISLSGVWGRLRATAVRAPSPTQAVRLCNLTKSDW